MMDPDPERHNSVVDRLAVDLSRLLTSGTLAAIPGVGGPVGAVLTELKLRQLETAVNHLIAAIEETAHGRDQPVEQLLDELTERPELRALLANALDAASATEDEQLRRMAGRILREGLADDAKVDECRFMLATLRQLEPAHLRVLVALLESSVVPDGGDKRVSMPLTAEQLIEQWPEGENVLAAVLATLQGAGLIVARMFSPAQIMRPDDFKKDKSGWTNMPTDYADGFAPTAYGYRLAVYSVEP